MKSTEAGAAERLTNTKYSRIERVGPYELFGIVNLMPAELNYAYAVNGVTYCPSCDRVSDVTSHCHHCGFYVCTACRWAVRGQWYCRACAEGD